MDALNPTVSYFNPNVGPQSTGNRADPDLILILTWMDARDAHIARYIAMHREMYPSARVLLIKSSTLHYFYRPSRIRSLKPALPVLREFIAECGSAGSDSNAAERPRMLVHVFSNGGVSTAVTLWNLLDAEVDAQSIPPYITIMDSCPGYGRWSSSYHALSLGYPTWLSPLVHLIIGVFWLMYVPTGIGLPQDNNAAALNKALWTSKEKGRTYIYGAADKAVAWQDVEAHGNEAEARGICVRREMFEHSGHVAHMRGDKERYRKIVAGTWEQADRSQSG
ncbi:hypothetical protein BGZ63DRAFT_359199 [Mariannaea sp. PMI_226]|nr:hypothetical protein BGZ63DRAFT_359199 [Mariannaea sp. PMI_226]